jgi:hypothetical protein
MANESVYYIPNGPKNIASLFPVVDLSQVSEYFVSVVDTESNIVASSPINKICKCAADEKIRIHFLNYLGTYDALNFLKPKIVHEDTASEFQNALNDPLEKTDTGIERFNVRANDTYEARLKCNETDMPWLMECFDSPKLFMEWTGIEGQADDYLPIVKIAGKADKLKNVDEYAYEFILQFKLSNEYQTIRN